MSEEENIQPSPDSELASRLNKAYFSKECTVLSGGVLINAQKGEDSVDIIITNEDVADIFNATNENIPFGDEDSNSEKEANEL